MKSNSVETELRELIIKRYGSLKAFTDSIQMPWTTLDSIIKRGVEKANINNILKITNELNIDTESLAYGSIVPKEPLSSSSSVDSELTYIYEQLNAEGRKKLVEYAQDLLSSGRYKKNTAKEEA